MKHKETTTTTLVLEALRQRDDFMTKKMLVEVTGRSVNRVNAAIHHLLTRCKAMGVLVENDGTSWWYALPEESDQRTHRVGERCPECKPRKKRRKPAGQTRPPVVD